MSIGKVIKKPTHESVHVKNAVLRWKVLKPGEKKTGNLKGKTMELQNVGWEQM